MTAEITKKTNVDVLLRLWLRCIVAPEPAHLAVLHASIELTDWQALMTLAQAHGVLPLLHELPDIERFCAEKLIDCQTIRAAAARTAMLDRLHSELLQMLEVQLKLLELPVLVLKGAALSRTHYRHPGMRPRVDTDLFIEAKNRGRWDQLMQRMGFESLPSNFSSLVLPERTYQKQLAGAYLQLDVHWSLSSRPMLGKKLNFQTLYDASIEFEHAQWLRMPTAIDALFVAVVHRLGHHRDQERYIWLYDIFLLWTALDEQAQRIALQRAETLGLAAILHEALHATSAIFPMKIPAQLPTREETAAQLLNIAQKPFWFDLKHATWRERWLLLYERLWAEPNYLRHRFNRPNVPIWLLQLRRWFS